MMTILISCGVALTAGCLVLLATMRSQQKAAQAQQQSLSNQLNQLLGQITARDEQLKHLEQQFTRNQAIQQQANELQRERFDTNQLKGLKLIQDSIREGMRTTQSQNATFMSEQIKHMNSCIEQLNKTTQTQLNKIEAQVEKRLTDGFEKTQATFTDVVKRLAIIDAAQQKITELSGEVVSLQTLLSDKRARGAFGEMQLATLVRDLIPEAHLSFQHTFSNGKRADCVLYLPEPTGTIAIDAKFPLEGYQRAIDADLSPQEKQSALQQFRQDIKKHIDDVANKYIIPGETTDGAILFIPSEAIFCEIHTNLSDIIQFSQHRRVWLVSPTTMMAVITTASAVIKDAATRKQVNLIQQHLVALGKDFDRFRTRMNQLAKHIEQAHQDVTQVHTTSQKIASRFDKIERVELPEIELPENNTKPHRLIEEEMSTVE